MQVLTLVGYQLPGLIAAVVALAMLWTSARSGPARTKGLIGVGLTLFAAICGLGMSVLQAWMFSGKDTATELQQFFAVMGAVGILLNLLLAAGLVLTAWGLCQATRSGPQAPH
ncbi:hypothetical protein [Pseudoxanthomonas sp. UTMC 1351]|uniref:hypothetical protein n=1 Tax=Pseudoxanthomonas sp. UTMC 1351 TaxID=2695853 RepID=UPI0034CE5A26